MLSSTTPTDALASTRTGRELTPGSVPAVVRAVALLELLARQGRALSLSELAALLALPKSSVHGLCHTLLASGYLRRSDSGFFIGPAVMGLAHAFVRHTSVAQEFATLWRELPAPPQETIILSVLVGQEVIYVGARNGNRPLGLAFNEGMRLPAHLAASGKAMLAWRDDVELASLFPSQTLPRLTSRGAASLEALRAELGETRRRGWSLDDEGVREGVVCFGAPVFDASGTPIAGLGLCVHKSMLDDNAAARHRSMLMDIALQLTQRMGGMVPEMSPPVSLTSA